MAAMTTTAFAAQETAGTIPTGPALSFETAAKLPSEIETVADLAGGETIEGASWDEATNTLTLTGFNRPELILYVNNAGDDFTVKLSGDNSLAGIRVFGDIELTSITFAGEGSLTVNKNGQNFSGAAIFVQNGSMTVKTGVQLTSYKEADSENGAGHNLYFMSDSGLLIIDIGSVASGPLMENPDIKTGTAFDIPVFTVTKAVETKLEASSGINVTIGKELPEGAYLAADTMAAESIFQTRPELKEELDGFLAVYQISVRGAEGAIDIKDTKVKVSIPLTDVLKGYKYYQAVYLGDKTERYDAWIEGDNLVFETTHLSEYAILGSDKPFEKAGTDVPKTSDSGAASALLIMAIAAAGAAMVVRAKRLEK